MSDPEAVMRLHLMPRARMKHAHLLWRRRSTPLHFIDIVVNPILARLQLLELDLLARAATNASEALKTTLLTESRHIGRWWII